MLFVSQNRITASPYVSGDYKKDIDLKEQKFSTKIDVSLEGIVERIFFASLPFFRLYKPFSFPLTCIIGCIRAFTSISELLGILQKQDDQGIPFQVMRTAIAVTSFAATLLFHPFGTLIKRGQDTILDGAVVIQALKTGKYETATKKTLYLIRNSLYFGLFFLGSLELSIACLVARIFLNLYLAAEEFGRDRWIEVSAHLLMVGVRGSQILGKAQSLSVRNTWEKTQDLFETKIREEVSERVPK